MGSVKDRTCTTARGYRGRHIARSFYKKSQDAEGEDAWYPEVPEGFSDFAVYPGKPCAQWQDGRPRLHYAQPKKYKLPEKRRAESIALHLYEGWHDAAVHHWGYL
jgi:hypothetical protein